MEFTITLVNGQEVTCIGYKKYEERIQGSDRNVLELWIDAEGTTFEEVDNLFVPENTSRIENSADTDELVYENYSIRAGIALVPKEIGEGERYEVKLAQLTYAEVQLQELREADLDNKEAIVTLYEMLGGLA